MKSLCGLLGLLFICVLILSKCTPSDGPIPAIGIIASYMFNGNADDESVNNNNGTIDGASFSDDRFEYDNSALSFDGIDDYVNTSLTSITNLQNLTVSAWVIADNDTKSMSVVSKYRHNSDNNLDDSFYLGILDGKIRWQLNAGDSYSIVDANDNVADGQWHHVVGIWDGTDQIVYVDGIQDSLLSCSGDGTINNTDLAVIIGRTVANDDDIRWFDGKIDDIRLYKRALTSDEILKLYNEEG